MSRFTEKQTVTFVTHKCLTCGVGFAMDAVLDSERLRDKANFYCPNGHAQCYTGDDWHKQIARLEAEKIALQAKVTETRAQAERDVAKAKAEAKRMERRAAASLCPYCNRSFATARMQRHIHTKHPEQAHA